MGKTGLSTNDPLTKKAYDEKLFRDTVKESFFAPLIGKTPDSLVHEKTNLKKSKGDEITFGIRMRLAGAGVEEGTQLEGNEEKLKTYDDKVTLRQYRHAVRDDGAMSRQRATYDVTEESENALKDWGKEKLDSLFFTEIFATPTRIAYKTSGGFQKTTVEATAKAALTAADSKLTATFVRNLYTFAKTGNNREFVPLRPIMIKGRRYYVLLTHDDAVDDLKNDADVKAAWQYAKERGDDNPIFTNADVIYNNVLVYGHENCPIANDAGGGSNVSWNKSMLLGAQSLVVAFGGNKDGERSQIVSETFDYGNEEGHAWELITGITKPVFNGINHGSFAVYNARTRISG